MQDFMTVVADAFGSYDDREDTAPPGLNAVAAEFGITALKARKLLITAGVYSTAPSRRVQELHAAGMKMDQIMALTGLSRASVHSYLPYIKIPYNLEELSVNAERIRLYRERKQKCVEFSTKLSVFCQVLFPKKSVGIPFFQQGIFPAFSGHYASLRMRTCSIR